MRRITIAAAAAVIGALAPVAATADAAVVGINHCLGYCGLAEYTVDYNADPGEANDVTLTVSNDRHLVRIDDPGATISPTQTPDQGPYSTKPSHCLVPTAHVALCVMPDLTQTANVAGIQNGTFAQQLNAPEYAVDVFLGDGNDRFRPGAGTQPVEVDVRGYTGNDDIATGPGYGSGISGDAGNDVLRTGASTPANVSGGDGDDLLYADNGVAGDSIMCDEYASTSPGVDSVWMDAADKLWPYDSNCDNVTVVP